MGTSVVGLWGQAVQLLRDATKDAASCADLSLFFRVKPVHDKLNSLPPPPKATWRKLVQQEVCHAVCAHATCLLFDSTM